MEQATVARIAVSTATYAIDKPYDYKIPSALCGKVDVGMRVLVPFGPGGRITEGFVLSLSESSSYPNLKEIEDVLDVEPILSQEMIRLALWVHNQCFCLLYQVLNAMLPAGLKFKMILSDISASPYSYIQRNYYTCCRLQRATEKILQRIAGRNLLRRFLFRRGHIFKNIGHRAFQHIADSGENIHIQL